MTSTEANKIINLIKNTYLNKIKPLSKELLNSLNEVCLFKLDNGMFLQLHRRSRLETPWQCLYKYPPDSFLHLTYVFSLLDSNQNQIVTGFDEESNVEIALNKVVKALFSRIDMFD